MADDSAALDTKKADRKVWLVKVPAFVAKRWNEACAASLASGDDVGPELGRVRVTPGATQSSEDFSMLLTGPMMADLPVKDYRMQVHTGSTMPMHVFSDSQGTTAVEGRVDQKFDLDVNRGKGAPLDASYLQLNRARNVANAAKTRTVQVLDSRAAGSARVPRPIMERDKRKMMAAARKEEPTKRVRMERDALEALLFRLFERSPHWSFGQLQRQTDQPAAFLKEVLPTVAVLNKKGPYKDTWEVKKEYRSAHAAAAAPSGADQAQ